MCWRAPRSGGSRTACSPSRKEGPDMRLRDRIETLFKEQVAELTASGPFRALESGAVPPAAYDQFVADVVRTHLKATEYVAFLCALGAPATSERRLRNLLEEIHHPGLLRQLAVG